jgi:ubiquitin-protein ligase
MAETEQPQPPGSFEGQGSSSGHAPYDIRFYIEDPTGDVYRAEARSDTLVRDVATDFFEERGWPARDQTGRPQRAVVERVDPDNPEHTERLRGDRTLHDSGVRDDDTLRVLPESVAGLFNPKERLRALVVDQREVQLLAEEDPQHIEVDSNATHAATFYEITFRYPGIMPGDRGPERTTEHRVAITLPADYPVAAPLVQWLTPIYHPNVSQRGAVCLGVLMHRYMPGLGLAYIVRMLRDIAQYRNYDMFSPFNPEAAEWAKTEEGQTAIKAIGGAPAETVGEAFADRARQAQRRAAGRTVIFTPANRFKQDE